MGSKASDNGSITSITTSEEEETASLHDVHISRAFYLGAFEVTQGQFKTVAGYNPSKFEDEDEALPVDAVSWENAVAFCKLLSEIPSEKLAGREYRLPTEAEWEYACRAGSDEPYCFGDSVELLDEYAWFGEVQNSHPRRVGQKKANRWGLYDMHGNVWEWCHDYYGEYSLTTEIDPKGPSIGVRRVFRGGCYFSDVASCRAFVRRAGDEISSRKGIGIRVAVTVR